MLLLDHLFLATLAYRPALKSLQVHALTPPSMDRKNFTAGKVRPEISQLDARIEKGGGTSSRIEMQPHRIQRAKI